MDTYAVIIFLLNINTMNITHWRDTGIFSTCTFILLSLFSIERTFIIKYTHLQVNDNNLE